MNWLGGLGILLVALEIGLEYLLDVLASWRCTAGTDGLEDLDDGAGESDVLVERGVRVIQEVDVDAIGVALRADRHDNFEGFSSLAL